MDNKLYKQIIKDISDKIISGDLKPEDRLPSENELMDIYNASKTTIEKSLMILANEGYIITIPRKGKYVTKPVVDNFKLFYSEKDLLSSIFATLYHFDFATASIDSKIKSLTIQKIYAVNEKRICFTNKQFFYDVKKNQDFDKTRLMANSDWDNLLLFNHPLEIQKQITLMAASCPKSVSEKTDLKSNSPIFLVETIFTHKKSNQKVAHFKSYFDQHYAHIDLTT